MITLGIFLGFVLSSGVPAGSNERFLENTVLSAFEEREAYNAYASGSTAMAEHGLRHLEGWLQAKRPFVKDRSERLSIETDLWLTHVRLGFVLEHAGRVTEANENYREAAWRRRLPEQAIGPMKQMVVWLDRNSPLAPRPVTMPSSLESVKCQLPIFIEKKSDYSFPAAVSSETSPELRFVINDEEVNGGHALTFLDWATDDVLARYAYSRHVDLLFSPSEAKVVVNDFYGSDRAKPVVVSLRDGTQTDGWVELSRLLPTEKRLAANHHVYLKAIRWNSETTLELEATGYGDMDPEGFRQCYKWNIGKSIRKSACSKD